MVHDTPASLPAVPVQRRGTNPYRPVAAVQGAFYLLTGLWPLLSLQSFLAVTGPKTDLWLVYTVGVLIAVIGATLLSASVRGRITLEIGVLGVGSAVVLAGIDLIFVARGVISWVYLLDAIAEAVLVGWWVVTYLRPQRPETSPESAYPHVQALLNRGHSVAPAHERATVR
jgi:hypothetical protein